MADQPQIDWKSIGIVFAGVNAALGLFVAAGVAEQKRMAREANAYRWTDKNRWEKD